MTRYLSVGTGLVFALGVAACNNDKLTDLNVNPNAPEDVPASTLFTRAVNISAQRWLGSGYSLRETEFVAQHLAEVQYPDEDRYARLGAADTQGNFDNAYTTELEDLQKVVQKGMATGSPGTYGPALVMRTWGFSYLTNTWGDVPYFSALAGDSIGGAISPTYDSQKAIYADFFQTLDKAAKDLASGGAKGNLGNGDPIYGGDALHWQRFANSLRARLAITLSNVDLATTDAQLRAAIASPGGLFQSNDDNAVMYWPGDGIYDNPWAVNFKTRDDHRMSQTLVNIMVANSDPRLAVFAMPTVADPTKYAGMPNGLSATDAGKFFNVSSRPGAIFYPGATAYGTFGGNGAKAPSFLMTYAEVEFILAEAAERGLGGVAKATAATHYANGIRASMEQWGVTSSAAIDAYIAKVAYKGGTEGLKQIATEKWIALYTDGGTAWTEWRRTCQPATIKPGAAAIQNTVPRRFMYSPTEYTVNKASLDAAVAAQGEDTFNSRMYWDTKPTAAPTYVAGCGQR